MTITWEDPDGRGVPARLSPTARRLIAGTDWAALDVFGSAGDLAAELPRLLSADPAVRAAAFSRVAGATSVQNSLYPAAVPVAAFTAAILGHPATTNTHEGAAPHPRGRPSLRAVLLTWLGELDDDASYGERPGDRPGFDPNPTVLAFRAIRPTLYEAVGGFLDDPDPLVREAALGTTVALLLAPGLTDRIPRAARTLRRRLVGDADRRERAAVTLALGAWGRDVRDLLDDRDPAIRVCAALAPVCAHDVGAARELRAALADPTAVDPWFPDLLPAVVGQRFLGAVVTAAAERTRAFEDMLPVARAMLAAPVGLDLGPRCWVPVLAVLFPGVDVDPIVPTDGWAPCHRAGPGIDLAAAVLTPGQRAFLRELADRDSYWAVAREDAWTRELIPQRARQRAALRELLERPLHPACPHPPPEHMPDPDRHRSTLPEASV
ncbi:HEAT repeat domain-containing protein [Embleya sp. NPDC050154]|uniref:HEAT repeat domain-containing protein n=1 Tax=Embleya sp. NPDC050154 TaxID=3363988 RepID=UPI0037B9C05D